MHAPEGRRTTVNACRKPLDHWRWVPTIMPRRSDMFSSAQANMFHKDEPELCHHPYVLLCQNRYAMGACPKGGERKPGETGAGAARLRKGRGVGPLCDAFEAREATRHQEPSTQALPSLACVSGIQTTTSVHLPTPPPPHPALPATRRQPVWR